MVFTNGCCSKQKGLGVSPVQIHGLHFAFVFFSNLYSLGKAFPRVIGSAAEAMNDCQPWESQEN